MLSTEPLWLLPFSHSQSTEYALYSATDRIYHIFDEKKMQVSVTLTTTFYTLYPKMPQGALSHEERDAKFYFVCFLYASVTYIV